MTEFWLQRRRFGSIAGAAKRFAEENKGSGLKTVLCTNSLLGFVCRPYFEEFIFRLACLGSILVLL